MSGPLASSGLPVRRHRNQGGYRGDTVCASSLLQHLHQAAERHGWAVRRLTDLGTDPVWNFMRPTASTSGRARRVYVSAGIHGDEPAGCLAALELLQKDAWPRNVELNLFPCLNPVGLANNRREGPEGLDFNRGYRHPTTDLVQAHVRWLGAQPDFDLALLLHEDWESDGFYLYELCDTPERSLAQHMIRAVSPICPVLQANRADDWPARGGIVRPDVDPMQRPDWPEALYLFQEKTELCYTLEAPSDYELSVRVGALVAAANASIEAIAGEEH